jgi:hypothetical protein
MRKQQLSEEQKVAVKITDLLSNVTLDLDLVGKFIAHRQPTTLYNRMILVAESAVDEKEGNNDYNNR